MLHQAADEIFAAFPRQVLPFDLASASAYADIVASREKQGNPISGFDAQIAAICRSQAASLATRNTRDFVDTGISLLDPWQPANRSMHEMVEEDLAAAAASAPTLRQVVALTRWIGPGRKLTQTGQLTMAEARHLVGLLETGDEIDPVIGTRMFRTRSSRACPPEDCGGTTGYTASTTKATDGA